MFISMAIAEKVLRQKIGHQKVIHVYVGNK